MNRRTKVITVLCIAPLLVMAGGWFLLTSPISGMNAPVDFWGRVVDQDDRPLAGVRVKLEVSQWQWRNYILDSNLIRETNRLQTDAHGLFSLTGRKGSGLRVEIHQEGYKLAKKSLMSFGYATSQPFRADPDNPVTFRMWKLRGVEPTITHEKKRGLKDTSLPLYVNLTTGESGTANVEKPDLKISVECQPPLNELHQNDRFDWRVSIQTVGGGLQFTTNTFMYWAPDDGYQQSFEFGAQRGDANWHYGRGEPLQFYVKTVNGHYARVGMVIQLWAGSGVYVSYSSCLNPSGSRNLEHDPMKYVRVPQR